MNILKPKISFGPKTKKVFKIIGRIILILTIIGFWTLISLFIIGDSADEKTLTAKETTETENCNVFGIVLHGALITYISQSDYKIGGTLLYDESSSEDIVYYIEQAEKDEKIKAIILEIDSFGGSGVAAEEVANALKKAQKPVVALIRDAGASAAYWSATGADIIFASQNSDVGSIGVTMSYLENTSKNEKDGLNYQQLISGIYKDAGNPDKPLTLAEKELFMRDVKIIHENFIKAVAENRKLDIEKVRALADGSSMLGEMALKNGLIDKIGGLYEIKEYLKEKIGEEVEICW